jgi:hypothetical protein
LHRKIYSGIQEIGMIGIKVRNGKEVPGTAFQER